MAATAPDRAARLGHHTVTETLGIIAAAWGVLMAISLQIRRITVRRSSADVSIAYLLVYRHGVRAAD
jgi:hypothetical protein